eukprot:TRINITY_DN49615_c0_g1_i1.p2 TRINITY_DN49615_c0_g1~~TRINITY_DN49615_c0_g1_i1.p2  ORF type:complete len:128 (-),score=14.11 TRINITY_DN49615_c0_g1_i1:49-432(-)
MHLLNLHLSLMKMSKQPARRQCFPTLKHSNKSNSKEVVNIPPHSTFALATVSVALDSIACPYDLELITSFSSIGSLSSRFFSVGFFGDIKESLLSHPFESLGANKEMPMNTNAIPSTNIIVLNASKT